MPDAIDRTPRPVAIAVFAKAPIAGQAKTRLIPRLGADGAAKLHSALTRHALATALAADLGPVSLWCTPDCNHPEFQRRKEEFGVDLHEQTGADLGMRMFQAFTQLCAHSNVLFIGTDCPVLTVGELRAAAHLLARKSAVVLIPAEDGGYVLIGLRRPAIQLFTDMPWGGEQVLRITRERLQHAGLCWDELPPSWDVDRPADLDRLRASPQRRLLVTESSETAA